MDGQNSSTDQEIEGDQQPSVLPILSEKDKSQESSDHVRLVSETIPLQMLLLTIAALPSQQKAVTRNTLATEPFQPILKVLADLERDDPKFAFPAVRLVGLYRRLWESCVSKHIDSQKLEQENPVLKEAGAHLRKETDGLQVRHDKQLFRLRFFEQALKSSRGRLVSVLDVWNQPSRLSLAGPFNNTREG